MDGVSLECCHGFQWNRDSSGSGKQKRQMLQQPFRKQERKQNAVSVK